MRQQRAAWLFVAPALIVLGVFFFLPVLAALAMSMTDFDLYALDEVCKAVYDFRKYAHDEG